MATTDHEPRATNHEPRTTMAKPHYLTYGIDAREASRRYYEQQRRDNAGCLGAALVILTLLAILVVAVYKAHT